MILSKLNGSGIPFILRVGELGLDAGGDGTLMSPAGDDAEELTFDGWRKGMLRSMMKGAYIEKGLDKRDIYPSCVSLLCSKWIWWVGSDLELLQELNESPVAVQLTFS